MRSPDPEAQRSESSGAGPRGGDADSADSPRSEEGLVLACYHDAWDVALDRGEEVRCSVRARHFASLGKEEKLLAAGDRVRVEIARDGACVIEESFERETVLSRLLPGSRRPTEQVIIANAEQLVAVASFVEPPLNRRLLDRFLVIGEDAELECAVVLNKIDLVSEDTWRRHAGVYETAGYRVIPTCAVDGRGVPELAALIEGRFSVLAGASGSGKSSLLNAIEPGLGIRVREISEKTRKGKHTTSNVTVFRLKDGSLVADTPGFRELGLWKIAAEELGFLFPEFRESIPECKYPSCSHGPEPGCAVKAAVEAGSIDADRYESYLKLHGEMSTRRKVEAPDGGPLPPV
jgi:ribosome biogenesis GTPase